MSKVEWHYGRMGLEGVWNLKWSPRNYPSYWHNVEDVFLRTKRHANNYVQIQVSNEAEWGFLFMIPSGSGIYQVGFPNTPETLDMLEDIIAYARTVQKEFPQERRVTNIRTLKRDGYLPKDYE